MFSPKPPTIVAPSSDAIKKRLPIFQIDSRCYNRIAFIAYQIAYNELIDSSLQTRRMASANMSAIERTVTFSHFFA